MFNPSDCDSKQTISCLLFQFSVCQTLGAAAVMYINGNTEVCLIFFSNFVPDHVFLFSQITLLLLNIRPMTTKMWRCNSIRKLSCFRYQPYRSKNKTYLDIIKMASQYSWLLVETDNISKYRRGAIYLINMFFLRLIRTCMHKRCCVFISFVNLL